MSCRCVTSVGVWASKLDTCNCACCCCCIQRVLRIHAPGHGCTGCGKDDLYAAGVSAAGGCSGLLPAGDHQGILQRLVTTWSLHELTRHVCMDTQSIIVSLVPQVSPDGNPLIGAIPGVKGAYIAAGCAHMSADFQ